MTHEGDEAVDGERRSRQNQPKDIAHKISADGSLIILSASSSISNRQIMFYPTLQLLLPLLSWRLFGGLAFAPAAIQRCRRQPLKLEFFDDWRLFFFGGLAFAPAATQRCRRHPLKLEFDDFSDLDLSIGSSSSDLEGKSTNGANLNFHGSDFPELQSIFQRGPASYTSSISSSLLYKLKSSGFENDDDIASFAMDFACRPEIISKILIQDFQWNAIDAHRARVGITNLVKGRLETTNAYCLELQSKDIQVAEVASNLSLPVTNVLEALPLSTTDETENKQEQEGSPKPKLVPWKSVLVNDKAKLRRKVKERKKLGNVDDKTSSTEADKDSYNYGLLDNHADRATYHTLFEELENLWSFMTVHQASSVVSEPPIRERTAEVYMRHARLFLGWVVDARESILGKDLLNELDERDTDEVQLATKSSSPLATSTSKASVLSEAINIRKAMWKRLQQRIGKDATPEDMKRNLSLTDIFLDQNTESVSSIVQYILWMRDERRISSNYEANILRGLIKIVKFRFAGELSLSNKTVRSATSKTPLDDIPVVIELRKFHRDAGNRSKKAPRSSDEGKKWLDWNEYLEVIELLKADLGDMIDKYEMESNKQPENVDDGVKRQKSLQLQKKEIAAAFQHYLILSFFACVPDRQRTFRELQLGRNFLRVDGDSIEQDMWVIRHSADDYKTGATYGERPPLPLLPSLTPAIDEFIERWRPCLLRKSEDTSPSSFLFHQSKTGNPLTSNSLYQIVSRCCYKYKEKKTNPHLLRDMIVTHVRKNSDASEKELEALALYMGHSVQMQRDSYDRRTLEQKVMPAVSLMQSINSVDKQQ